MNGLKNQFVHVLRDVFTVYRVDLLYPAWKPQALRATEHLKCYFRFTCVLSVESKNYSEDFVWDRIRKMFK